MTDYRWAPVAIATAALALACGGSDPIADFAESNAAVSDARAAVEKAKKVVSIRQDQITEAQKLLAVANNRVREAEGELARLEAEVDRSAVDTVLFREVQKRLLEDEELSSVAIVAAVTDGVVTLSGSVDNAKLRDHAIQIAGDTSGVERVESRIDVSVSSGPPES